MELERNDEIVVIETVLTKATASRESIVEDDNATDAQKALRTAWLKG